MGNSTPYPVLHPIITDRNSWQGYTPSLQYSVPIPKVIGWSIPEDRDTGFIDGTGYKSPNIACHLKATPAPISAPCNAGASVELQWNPWPDSHKGPVLTYLANCKGPCEKADASALEFFKIEEFGLQSQIEGQDPRGFWASDKLINDNSTWTVQLPKDIAAGNYVMRHEIIALHSAGNVNGAQNYPQCISLQIQSSGSANPQGVLATDLYTPESTMYNLYEHPLKPYKIPGPALYESGSGEGSGSGTETPTTSSATEAGTTTSGDAPTPVVSGSAPATASATAIVPPTPNEPGNEDGEDDDYDSCEL